MRSWVWGGLLLVACGGGAKSGQSGAKPTPSSHLDSQGRVQTSGSLTVANVLGTFIDDEVIVVDVHVRVDGSSLKSCHLEDLERDVCVEDLALAPGPHQLAVGISCRNKKTLGFNHPNGGACEFTWSESLDVGVREAWTLDLTQATRHFAAEKKPSDDKVGLSVAERAEPDDDCQGLLERLLGTSTCDAPGMTRAAELARAARDACEPEDLEDSATSQLIDEVLSAELGLGPHRCFRAAALRDDVPKILFSGSDGWPPETLEPGASSWSWVRSTAPRGEWPRTSAERLEWLVTALDAAVPRARVFDDLVAAFTPKSERKAGEAAAMRAAERAPFSFDPRTPEGHRNFILVATEVTDGRYADFVARGVSQTPRLHCSRYPQATLLSIYFTRDGLSRAEWEATQAMMRRTPPTERVHDCDYVFRASVKGEVSHEERLRWLFQFDCDGERHAALRGDRTEVHLRPDIEMDAGLRSKLIGEFRGCLEARCARESCSWWEREAR